MNYQHPPTSLTKSLPWPGSEEYLMDESHVKNLMQSSKAVEVKEKRDRSDVQHSIIDSSAPMLQPSSRIHMP